LKTAIETDRELTVLMERTVGLFRDFDLTANLSPEQYESTGKMLLIATVNNDSHNDE
jgi:hypothetical protein